jgi:hypothetical protein
MPGRWPWKVDCTDDSDERCGSGGGSFLRPCGWRGADVGGLWCWQRFGLGSPESCVGPTLETAGMGGRRGAAQRFFQTKAQCFSTRDCDACGYRYPLGGVDAATFSVIRLRVKTIDHRSQQQQRCIVNLLGGIVVEPRFTPASDRCLLWQVLVFRVFLVLPRSAL